MNGGSRHKIATGGWQFLRLTWPHMPVGSKGTVPTMWDMIPPRPLPMLPHDRRQLRGNLISLGWACYRP